jgi:hypothetical protein
VHVGWHDQIKPFLSACQSCVKPGAFRSAAVLQGDVWRFSANCVETVIRCVTRINGIRPAKLFLLDLYGTFISQDGFPRRDAEE